MVRASSSAIAIMTAVVVLGSVACRDSSAATPLRWAPPELSHPRTLSLGTGFTVSRLDRDRDYIIKLPNDLKRGGTVIDGGRNVVLIGGRVTIPRSASSDYERRAVYIQNTTGTVHIEGLQVEGRPGAPLDAIAIAAPLATVQVENVRVTGVTGSEDGFHSDVIQPWGGVRALRIDHLTGYSNYQGLYLPSGPESIGSADIRNVNLISTRRPTQGGGVMLWLTNECRTYPTRLSEVYLQSNLGRSLGTLVRPAGWTEPCPLAKVGGKGGWPDVSAITGQVKPGRPKGGDFVAERPPGAPYESPGYE